MRSMSRKRNGSRRSPGFPCIRPFAVGKFPSRFVDAILQKLGAWLLTAIDSFRMRRTSAPWCALRGLQSAIPAHWRDFVQPISSPAVRSSMNVFGQCTKQPYYAVASAGRCTRGDRCPSHPKRALRHPNGHIELRTAGEEMAARSLAMTGMHFEGRAIAHRAPRFSASKGCRSRSATRPHFLQNLQSTKLLEFSHSQQAQIMENP